ncbi:MAG: GAF domain-containing sensor histidine kinase [Betaproteobacteria bacterium]|nr:GAF domain-containing sensor histidine kinase [Betaproteobacteria bacterium]
MKAGRSIAERGAARGEATADSAQRLREIEEANRLLEQEVVQHRMVAELARGQSEMLIQSLNFLAAESNLDKFLGHVLKVTVQQLQGVGGTLWFPDATTNSIRLHLEYLDSRIIPAAESHHPAVLHPLPAGGRPVSTFPMARAETYVLSGEVGGMPEENRAYINSLGVHTLLTVPMMLGKETVGWICVRSSKSDAKELESKLYIAEALAGQATLAVQMARLGEQARQAAVLEERNRIARDIHDTLAQGFTGVVVNLEAATRTLKKDNIESTLEHIEHARQLAQAGLAEARLSVRALRPEALQQADLTNALETLLRRVEASGTLHAHFFLQGEKIAMSGEVESELLRIAQEGMTNILKHAKAQHVEVKLVFGADAVTLSIADDGAGFDPRGHHDGFGLLGMRERAESIGARLLVSSGPAQGTRVETVIPRSALG